MTGHGPLRLDALAPEQRDGLACVVCGVDYTATPGLIPNLPVGTVDGGQVFACTSCTTLCHDCGGDRRRYHEMPGSGGEKYWDDCETCEGTGWEVAQ
ncbi:MAG TPA: hypothetical protein VF202_07430 [Trueperaceae bacterium]